jgi:hypothetical protein
MKTMHEAVLSALEDKEFDESTKDSSGGRKSRHHHHDHHDHHDATGKYSVVDSGSVEKGYEREEEEKGGGGGGEDDDGGGEDDDRGGGGGGGGDGGDGGGEAIGDVEEGGLGGAEQSHQLTYEEARREWDKDE